MIFINRGFCRNFAHMLQRLKQRWKVNGLQLFLILCVFAITGTTTAYLTRQVTYWLDLDSSNAWYWILKVVMLVFGYQVLILLFAIPFGQFSFFWNYEKKIWRRVGFGKKSAYAKASVDKPNKHNEKPSAINFAGAHNPKPETSNPKPYRIAVFASGAGSNAQKIIDHFRDHSSIKVALIVCNKPGAGVLDIAAREKIPSIIIDKEKFFRGNGYVDELKQEGIDFIVLAGFLWKIPVSLLRAWPHKMVNIHPALLPGYGGKGMYGAFVHKAVIEAQDKESGISIHFVDDIYDHGQVIFQARCAIAADDTPETLAQKIHQLEHLYYPRIIEKILSEPGFLG
jgi:formyltetrahydrofolate-dependent phosphoribosylglycinamide formyltransferase